MTIGRAEAQYFYSHLIRLYLSGIHSTSENELNTRSSNEKNIVVVRQNNANSVANNMTKKSCESNSNKKNGSVIQSVAKTNPSRPSTKRKVTNTSFSKQNAGDIIDKKIDHPSLPKTLKTIHVSALNECQKSSTAVGEESLKWIISPHKTKKFLNQYFENNVLHIKRDDKNYYKNIFSCKALDKLLRNSDKPMIFGKVSIRKLSSIVICLQIFFEQDL